MLSAWAIHLFPHLSRKFNKTIEILQGDIEALENDKTLLEKKVEIQSKRGILSDITVAGRRTLGGRGSPYSSPFSSPNISHRDSGSVSAVSEGVTVDNTLQTPLLLSRVSVNLSRYLMSWIEICPTDRVFEESSRLLSA